MVKEKLTEEQVIKYLLHYIISQEKLEDISQILREKQNYNLSEQVAIIEKKLNDFHSEWKNVLDGNFEEMKEIVKYSDNEEINSILEPSIRERLEKVTRNY